MGPCCLFPVVSALLLQVVGSLDDSEVKYLPVDGELVLEHTAASGPLTDIVWKFNGNLVVEWSRGISGMEYYPRYINRSELDPNTARLRIFRLQQADGGIYSVDINNKVNAAQFQVRVVKKLPAQIQVWVSPLVCSQESKDCHLNCGQDLDQNNYGPLTFSWKINKESTWEENEQKLMVNNNDVTRQVPEFQCRVKSPVDEIMSETIPNPFFKSETVVDNTRKIIIGVIVGIIIVSLIAVVAVIYWKWNDVRNLLGRFCGENQADTSQQNGQARRDEEAQGDMLTLQPLMNVTNEENLLNEVPTPSLDSVDPHEDTVVSEITPARTVEEAQGDMLTLQPLMNVTNKENLPNEVPRSSSDSVDPLEDTVAKPQENGGEEL